MQQYCLTQRYLRFQSTLPREERRYMPLPIFQKKEFQSTLPREERPSAPVSSAGAATDFNPRSHERSDDGIWDVSFSLEISIHAPTRGATQKALHAAIHRLYFNPRSHERSDNCRGYDQVCAVRFQSTLPREERQRSGLF